jgi:dCMP deaminase
MTCINKDNKEILKYINIAKEYAIKSTCLRRKCGSIVVSDDEIIGVGFNSPVNNLESQRRCSNNKDLYDKRITDKTCCVHAEERAMIDALSRNTDKIKGSRIYYVSVDNNDNIMESGEPYCTLCSKMALEIGIKEFVLYKKDYICVYDTEEYNTLSYKYKSQN